MSEIPYDASVISLGAGVQSTVLTLMADMGRLDLDPMPTYAIFADTYAEPQQVYRHLDWLEGELRNITIVRADNGRSLKDDVWAGESRDGTLFTTIPTYLKKPDGIMRRQCTVKYKIAPIQRWIRQNLLGLARGERAAGKFKVIQYMGISFDEIYRIRDSQENWIDLSYPLVDARLSREDCKTWFTGNYPGRELPRSACVFCPFRNNREWEWLAIHDPDGFEFSVKLDERIRRGHPHNPIRAEAMYLHRSRRPLADAMADYRAQGKLWSEDDLDAHADECAGVCFV